MWARIRPTFLGEVTKAFKSLELEGKSLSKNSFIEEVPQLDLKPPFNLKYAYLGDKETLPSSS